MRGKIQYDRFECDTACDTPEAMSCPNSNCSNIRPTPKIIELIRLCAVPPPPSCMVLPIIQ